MRVFVDTSAWYALMVPEDSNYEAAQRVFDRLRMAEATLLTTNYIALECTSLIQRRHGFEAARTFLARAMDLLDLVWIGKDQHAQGMRLWLKSGRRTLSLVDCTSFWVMREQGVRQAVAFDAHFREAGFEVLPAADHVAERRAAYRTSGVRRAHA